MRTSTFELPNGFMHGGELVTEVEIRKLDGLDEEFIVDKDELRAGYTINRLLKRVLVRMGDVDDPKVLSSVYDSSFMTADTNFLLVEMRKWGVGPVYRFDIPCQACEKVGKHRIDLTTLCTTQQPHEYRGKLENIDTLTFPDDDPLAIVWKPLLVSDQAMLSTIKRDYPREKPTRELLLQLKSVNGAKPTVKGLQAMSLIQRNAMRECMDSKTGGIDLELALRCRECDYVWQSTMPIKIRSFFFQTAASSPNESQATPCRVFTPTFTGSEELSTGSLVKLSA